jgi:polyphosphate kinase
MFAATDTAWAPWWVVNSDDKKRARLNVISHLLELIPYEPLDHPDVELPRRQEVGDYQEASVPTRHVPARY